MPRSTSWPCSELSPLLSRVGRVRPATTVAIPSMRTGLCAFLSSTQVKSAAQTVTDEKMIPKIDEPASSRPMVVPAVPRKSQKAMGKTWRCLMTA